MIELQFEVTAFPSAQCVAALKIYPGDDRKVGECTCAQSFVVEFSFSGLEDDDQKEPLRASTKSVFSQEKPPSASGWRPKWP